MRLILLFALLFNFSNILGDEYWHYREYLDNFPIQKTKIANFKKLVEEDAKKLNQKQNKTAQIVFIYPGKQISDYWRRNITALERRLTDSGVKFNIKLIPVETGSSVNEETKDIIRAIKNRPDYLIFTLNVKDHAKLINQILSFSKIKLILLNITTPLKTLGKNQPFFYVGFDHEEGSKKIIETIKERYPDGGDYMVLYHSEGYVSQMRGDYMIKELRESKKWNLKARYYTNGQGKRAEIAINDFFKKNKKVDLIISCSTDISLAAAKYKNKKEFILNGWGGGSSEIDNIQSKKSGIDFTVMRINDDSAIAVAEAIKLDLQNKSNMVPMIFSGEMVIIDKNTSKEKLRSLEKRAFRYSNEEI
ncbi:hypothetical protein BIY24_11900 [Halobacteriovorax marinus]|uniref:substrate-binding domain-containing protein n=1 Tax=Halobacteriovorax marinus TaxID=97084 RepID=UPI000BC2D466|nr:substrate-binding domain-containing protein [Halobacteriovorax marinus]ATH08622.1 hypothetical protein BIY24_11900 [Halobacteriovorax marinus]